MPTSQADKFFNLSNDLFCIEGADGYFSLVNPAFEKYLGYDDDSLLTKPVISFIHPEDIELTLSRFYQADSVVRSVENRFRCADGSYKWLSWTGSPGHDNDIYWSARDITREKELERKLNSALAKNQLILDSTLDMICTFDRKGNFLSVSKACEKIMGYTQEEIRGRCYIDFLVEEDFEKTLDAGQQVQRGVEVTNFENRYKRKDDSLVLLSWSARWSEEEEVMYAIARDNTEATSVEQRILLTERRFKSLVQAGSDLITIIDQNGLYAYLSPSISQMGYVADFLIGKSPFDFIHADDRDRVMAAFETVLESELLELDPFRYRTAAGTYRWVKTIAINRLQDPAVEGVVTNSVDVTESLKLEREKEQARERVQNLIDNFIEGFFLLDRRYTILDYNVRAKEMMGGSSFAVDKMLWDVFPKSAGGPFHRAFEEAFVKNTNVKIINYSDQLKRWYEVTAYPYQDNLTVFLKDVTEAKIRELNLKLEKNVLKMNSNSAVGLKSILDHYLLGLNEIYPHMHLAVNLVDKKGRALFPLSSPTTNFCLAFEQGAIIAEGKSICAEATRSKQVAGYTDLSEMVADPRFREFAVANNFRSSWSFPVMNEYERVIATAAAFYSSTGPISESEEEIIKRIITIVQILIESHQTREFLEINIERYKLVTQASKDAIYDWAIPEQEIHWGEGMEKVFGYRNSITGFSWWEDRVYPQDLERVLHALEKALNNPTENGFHYSYRFLKADGTLAHVIEDGFIIRNENGEAIRMVGAMQDHTEIKEHQQKILKQNDVLREIARINSHYIRKPLANILALIEAIKSSEGEDLQELVKLLELSGYELDEITRQIAKKTYLD